MNYFRYWVLSGLTLALSGCGVDPSKNNSFDPSTSTFQATSEFTESLIMLSGKESNECIKEIMGRIGNQIALSGPNGIADSIDAVLKIELNETCSIKRK